ncbi:hypothetical protein [Kocuria rhizophila]|uniref:hypothetical protein n=1 Tax=Kocuria rhizophila TaxID=72000 RepID=UPI0015E0FC51|nr:hypothetical protein [Kocuria rhizophila]
MFPTDVRFADSTMTVVDTPGVRAALLPLCQRGERFPEATMVERVIHRHGFTVEVLQGGMYHLGPATERPTEEQLGSMRRLLTMLAPHLPSQGLDDHAPRIQWQAVADDGYRHTWRVVAGVFCESSEPVTGPDEYGYEYNVRYTTVRRERLYLSRRQAQDLLPDPLDPSAEDLERARRVVNAWDDDEVSAETAEVEPESVCLKTS